MKTAKLQQLFNIKYPETKIQTIKKWNNRGLLVTTILDIILNKSTKNLK